MIKVFLVEDEKIVRDGIKNGIDWEVYGFEFAGEAADGELALPLIEMSRPDILITDIRMPFMDGLELAGAVKERLPSTIIIFLSGYDDFEYAQRAIHIGASEYLLKPVSKEMLLAALRKVKPLIVSGLEESRSVKIEAMELDMKNIDTSKFKKDRLRDFMRIGNSADVENFVNAYIHEVGEQLKSLMFRQYLIFDAFMEANKFFDELGIDKEVLTNEFGNTDTFASAVTDIHLSKEYLLELLSGIIARRDELSGKKYTRLLNKSKDYIKNHYMDADISLNMVAEYVGLSPNHFSTIFKQESGISFIEYLTETRMNEAKKLLRSTDKKTSDIAFEVGYRDPHYFSSIFKKYQGDTPTAYREYRNGK